MLRNKHERSALRCGSILALMSLLCAARTASPQRSVVHKDGSPRPITSSFRICAGGDVTLGTNLDTAWARTGLERLRQYGRQPEPDSLTAPLRQFLTGADVVLLNIEGAIGSGPAKTKCSSKSSKAGTCYAFRSPPSAARALRRLGGPKVAIVGNVANNHARDAGNDGRAATISALTAAGVRVTGRDTLPTPVALANGDTIGVLGF